LQKECLISNRGKRLALKPKIDSEINILPSFQRNQCNQKAVDSSAARRVLKKAETLPSTEMN
jgi:hypothetical protein